MNRLKFTVQPNLRQQVKLGKSLIDRFNANSC